MGRDLRLSPIDRVQTWHPVFIPAIPHVDPTMRANYDGQRGYFPCQKSKLHFAKPH